MDNRNKEKMAKAFKEFNIKKDKQINQYHHGYYIGIKTKHCILNNNQEKNYDEITKNGNIGNAVMIIPKISDNEFLMVVQSRPNTKEKVVIEFPAGLVNKKETFEEAAKRELLEETGYSAEKWQEIEWHYPDSGCNSGIIKTFLAQNLHKIDHLNLDSDENLTYIKVNEEDIKNMINNNTENPNTKEKIVDGSTKLAYYIYKNKFK